MDDVKSSESPSKMSIERSTENFAVKQDNMITKVEDIRESSASKPHKLNRSSFPVENNSLGKSILKPSLLSLNCLPSSSSDSAFKQTNSLESVEHVKVDNNDCNNKHSNGDGVKFVPLIKTESQKQKSADPLPSNVNSRSKAVPTFVFGQNLHDRVLANTKLNEGTSTDSSSGESTVSSDMLFTSVIKTGDPPEILKDKETKSLTESAREYEESRANKRKYEEVQVKTGEEEEINIISISCKLFLFDKTTSNWQERGRGILRLNDFEINERIGSRLVFRTAGSLRVVLNTKIWAEMTIDKASDKSIRFTAIDSNGEIKVFLVTSSIDDSKQLYLHLQSRLEKEIAQQKRKKLETM